MITSIFQVTFLVYDTWSWVLVLVWEMDGCMVLIININNDVEECTCGYQNCDTSQMLVFGGISR